MEAIITGTGNFRTITMGRITAHAALHTSGKGAGRWQVSFRPAKGYSAVSSAMCKNLEGIMAWCRNVIPAYLAEEW